MRRDLPDRGPDTEYTVTTLPDQQHLTNALTIFKMTKATLGLSKDIAKELKDDSGTIGAKFCEKYTIVPCIVGGAATWGAACVPMIVCYVVWAILWILTKLGYYINFYAYHLTGITYEGMAASKNKYDKYAYLNHKASDKWIDKALRFLQYDMFDQHTAVRRDLQDRHTSMEDNINKFSECATNHILYETTKAIATANGGVENKTPAPTPSCIDILNLPPSRRRLVEGAKEEGVNEIIFERLPGYKGVSGELGNILEEVDEVEEKEIEMIDDMHAMDKKIDNMMSAMAAIQIKLDMDPTIDIDPKVNNDKSKKPKARKPKAVKDDGGEEIPDKESLFNRNLLETGNDEMKRTIEAMEQKLDSVEEEIKTTSISMQDEVELIKGEVKGMKVKVESMESKVDKIEQSMKNIEDMLSKLLTTGGVAAGQDTKEEAWELVCIERIVCLICVKCTIYMYVHLLWTSSQKYRLGPSADGQVWAETESTDQLCWLIIASRVLILVR